MNRTIEAILKLSAKVGSLAGFNAVAGKLDAVDKKAKAFNRTQSAISKQADALALRATTYLASGALAYGGVRAYRDFADMERRLTRLGINADATREQMRSVMDDVRQIADDAYAPVDNVVAGLENLIASGKSLDEAMALLPAVAKTAQASDSSFGEMATTADALSGSLQIANSEMERAFDIIAYGGKAGKFELRDMAAELPSLAPAFAALGYKGEDGLRRLTAALQTVRKETGSSSEAATSFMDVLTKMEGETVSNNFKKFGVNIREELAAARKEGKDLLETFIELSVEAVDGDLSKLPQLFTDKQMLIGMRALINRTDEYKDLVVELNNALGTVSGDLKRIGEDGQASIDRLANSWQALKQSIGEGLAPVITPALDGLAGAISEDTAVSRALKAEGATFAEREAFKRRHLFGDGSDEEWNYYANKGGANLAPDNRLGTGIGLSSDGLTLPTEPALPVPRARGQGLPVPQIPAGLSLPATGGPSLPSAPSDLVGDPIGARMGGAMNVLAEAESKLQAGGAAAAREIEQGGQAVASGGQDAAAAIRDAAASIATAGQQAAAAIRSAAGQAGSARIASGNPGRSMPDAGAPEAGGGW